MRAKTSWLLIGLGFIGGWLAADGAGWRLGWGSLSHAQQEPRQTAAPAAAHDGWLAGSTDEKLSQIERQLRGLDVSMAEIGYRYGELLEAAKTQNWEYAQYQAEKIDLSLGLAIERRPKRAKSAQAFLNDSLPPVLTAIRAHDARRLTPALEGLYSGCVACHKAENVLYFKESVDRIRQRSQ